MKSRNLLRKSLRIPSLLAVVAAAVCFARSTVAGDLGITVSPSGVMLKDGKPYRAIGGHDPFDSVEWFENDNPNYVQTFTAMKASGLHYARLTCKGYSSQWKMSYLYTTDKATYFQKMDAMIDSAAQNDVGIILGFFWTVNAVSDYYGETQLAAAIPGSQTYVSMAAYVTDMAEHYKNNPTVFGYDVIGELSLEPDQPNSGQVANERWTAEATQVVYANLFQAVHAVDPKRLLSSGNGGPPENQFHRTNYSAWYPDTPAQYTHEYDITHPDPANVLGIHYYPTASTGAGTKWDVNNALSLQRRKPLFGGEFGGQYNGQDGSQQALATNFNFALSQLLGNRVPLMGEWYMGAPQYFSAPYNLPCWTTSTNAFAYQWNALAQANSQYQYGPWKSLSVASGDWSSVGSWDSGAVPSTADDVYVPTDAATARTLSIASTAYARNMAVGTGSTGDIAASIDINGAGQLILGQNSSLTFATTTDGTNATTITVNGAHGQLLDTSGRSAILLARQNTGETKPAIVATTASAYQMRTGDRANISGSTGELNLFDGLYVGQSGTGSTATVYQSGGIVRAGLDANVAGGAPTGLAFAAPSDGAVMLRSMCSPGAPLPRAGSGSGMPEPRTPPARR